MVKQFIQRKLIRQQAPARLQNGKWYRSINGVWITEKEFNEAFPLMLFAKEPKENPDKTKDYLYK